MKLKLSIVGCGNMARPVITSMRKRFSDLEIYTYDKNPLHALELSKEVSGLHITDLKQLSDANCEVYLIAVKPQQFDDLASDLIPHLSKDMTIISIMAGVSVSTIQKKLGVERVVRVMPNTPVMVGEGVSALYFSSAVEDKSKQDIIDLISSGSSVFVFDSENKIDIITPYSGSGPAYIFEITRIMIDKLVSMGIDETIATPMIKKTILGASKLMLETEETPEELRDKVTSIKGVTYEALEVFKAHGLEKIMSEALDAAYNRASKLG